MKIIIVIALFLMGVSTANSVCQCEENAGNPATECVPFPPVLCEVDDVLTIGSIHYAVIDAGSHVNCAAVGYEPLTAETCFGFTRWNPGSLGGTIANTVIYFYEGVAPTAEPQESFGTYPQGCIINEGNSKVRFNTHPSGSTASTHAIICIAPPPVGGGVGWTSSVCQAEPHNGVYDPFYDYYALGDLTESQKTDCGVMTQL